MKSGIIFVGCYKMDDEEKYEIAAEIGNSIEGCTVENLFGFWIKQHFLLLSSNFYFFFYFFS